MVVAVQGKKTAGTAGGSMKARRSVLTEQTGPAARLKMGKTISPSRAARDPQDDPTGECSPIMQQQSMTLLSKCACT